MYMYSKKIKEKMKLSLFSNGELFTRNLQLHSIALFTVNPAQIAMKSSILHVRQIISGYMASLIYPEIAPHPPCCMLHCNANDH